MLRVALTGGIGSGKTAVSDLLAECGAVVVDADLLAREVVSPGTPGLTAVVSRFSPEVLAADQTLDRAALARLVFADTAARRDLEAIIHPAVRRRAAELERQAPADAVVVHVIPLLVETGQADAFDVCVVVDVDEQVQLARVVARSGWSEAEARARIAAQASRDERLAVADLVLSNNGTLEELRDQVRQLWQRLRTQASSA
jgi:dephospho-CoA kinase